MNQNITVEIWKDIKGYEGHYQVSSHGNIKSIKFGRQKTLTLKNTHKGYHNIQLFKNGKMKGCFVHRIVAENFLDHLKVNHSVDHLDANKKNNHYTNLEWVTNKENSDRKVNMKLHAFGERVHTSKLTQKDIEHIRREFMLNSSTKEDKTLIYNALAKGYGLFRGTVKEICSGKRWSHLSTYAR